MAVTRRDFLMRVGQLGGYGAAFTFMQSLGLLPAMEVTHEVATLRKVPGHGTTRSDSRRRHRGTRLRL